MLRHRLKPQAILVLQQNFEWRIFRWNLSGGRICWDLSSKNSRLKLYPLVVQNVNAHVKPLVRVRIQSSTTYCHDEWSHYFIEKGFITIDGASLTITNDIEEYFSIAVIPFTWDHTIFSGYEVGSVVNLEVDMTAKYIEKILSKSQKLEKAN